MAVMRIKFEVLKDPRLFHYNDKEGINLWVQDLEDKKFKTQLVGFDTESWDTISVGDQYEARCKVGKRQNKQSQQWETQFVIDANTLKSIDGHRKEKQDGYVKDDTEDADIPF